MLVFMVKEDGEETAFSQNKKSRNINEQSEKKNHSKRLYMTLTVYYYTLHTVLNGYSTKLNETFSLSVWMKSCM